MLAMRPILILFNCLHGIAAFCGIGVAAPLAGWPAFLTGVTVRLPRHSRLATSAILRK